MLMSFDVVSSTRALIFLSNAVCTTSIMPRIQPYTCIEKENSLIENWNWNKESERAWWLRTLTSITKDLIQFPTYMSGGHNYVPPALEKPKSSSSLFRQLDSNIYIHTYMCIYTYIHIYTICVYTYIHIHIQ